MLKSIASKPAAYIFLVFGVCFLICYLAVKYSSLTFDPTFYPYHEPHDYQTIDELFAGVEKHQAAKEYETLNDLLRRADVNKLVEAELLRQRPRVILIGGTGPKAFGIEYQGSLPETYGSTTFPGTTEIVTDPGFDLWIPNARQFTTQYNAKLEAEMKKQGR